MERIFIVAPPQVVAPQIGDFNFNPKSPSG
jgi:hypothetical protein